MADCIVDFCGYPTVGFAKRCVSHARCLGCSKTMPAESRARYCSKCVDYFEQQARPPQQRDDRDDLPHADWAHPTTAAREESSAERYDRLSDEAEIANRDMKR